nr:coniferyl aldehyde dehydrogenase [Gemmobacter nectariphilus]
MNAPPPEPQLSATVKLRQVFAAQSAAFRASPAPSAARRRKKLRRLKRQIGRYQTLLAAALAEDFGHRAAIESKIYDLLSSTLEINHLLRHVGGWMRPSRRPPELVFLTNSLKVTYQPKGVVGVIVPWNFPIYLAIGPVAAAIAAGNRVMVKMPETTPRTRDVLARMIAEVFPEDQLYIAEDLGNDREAFVGLPFNHLIFTGSPLSARPIMMSAAENLTPVTLELGGKSPAIVAAGFPLDDAALRIVHGKSANCGQTCVAPDYALVPKGQARAFADQARTAFAARFGDSVKDNPDYTSVIDDRQLLRLLTLLDDAAAKGATIIPCAAYDRERDGRRLPLHLVLDTTPDMLIRQEEVFGPLLPILEYDGIDQAIAHVAAGPRPLALYYFGRDRAETGKVLRQTQSGGVTINDWCWHVVNHAAPFGGIGNSGMGSYHGVEGFRELSHARTVFRKHRFYPISLLYPPYGGRIQRLLLKLFLGKGDRSLK